MCVCVFAGLPLVNLPQNKERIQLLLALNPDPKTAGCEPFQPTGSLGNCMSFSKQSSVANMKASTRFT